MFWSEFLASKELESKMIELFVKKPVLTLMFVLVFVVLGAISYFNLVIERDPKVKFPMVTVKVIYPGAAPQEIESQLIKKIEDAVTEISQINKVTSTANENYGFVMIEFDVEADVNIKAMEVKDKVDAIQNDFPLDAKKPEIAKFDPTVEPIMELVLSAEKSTDIELFEYADKKLKNFLSIVEGVASVEIFGGKKRQINVLLDGELMKKHYISINDVIYAIASRNLNIPGGSIERVYTKTTVRLVGEFTNVNELRNLIVVTKEGNSIKLSQIARIEDSYKKVESITQYNGKSVVGLSIKKLSDGDAVKIAKKIKLAILKLEKDLPDGMKLITAYDSTQTIVADNNGTIINIIFGILLTTLIMFIFVGSFRTTIVSTVVIPTSIISTFLLMDFSNFTINSMTLLAIGTALGTLIANAIVVIESIQSHIEKGEDPQTAAINGTKEVVVAVLASAGTNIVVFTPIAFMSGIVGQFMKQFGLTVVYATAFSIFASFTLTPMLCAVLFKKLNKKEEPSFYKKLMHTVNGALLITLKEYRYLFNWSFKHKVVTYILLLLCIAGMIYPMKHLGSEFFSKSDLNLIRVAIDLPQGSSLMRTKEVVKEIEKLVVKVPEVTSYLSITGKNDTAKASIIVNLTPKELRKRTDENIIDSLIPDIAKIPEAEVNLSNMEMDVGGFGDISINVYGLDYDTIIKLSKEMMNIMKETGYFRSVNSFYKEPKNEYRFQPNDKKVIEYGLKNLDLGGVLRSSISGNDANIYKENGEEYKINVELDEAYKKTMSDIEQISLPSKDGLIPLSALGELTVTKASPSINRRDKMRIIQINGYLSKGTAGEVEQILNKEFKSKLNFSTGYGFRYIGFSEFFDETAKEIGKAFFLAIILTYMLLAAIMNSFTTPFVIASSIATSFIGVFLFMFFMEYSINIGSMMAMVMLVGIVVNNSILILDYAANKQRDGHPLKQALWEGVHARFRMVLMTSIAIIAGTLPQLFDPYVLKASMGGVMIGGMLGSVIFTYFSIPLIYYSVERIKEWIKKKLWRKA